MNEAPVTIATANEADGAAWDRFVGSRPEGSFYHLFGWKRVNERALGHRCEYLMARDAGGGIVGVLPLVEVSSRLFGRILCSMPFVNYGGPIAIDESVALALLERAKQLAADMRADYLELRCAQALTTSTPVSLRKVSLTVELNPDPEALFASYSPKHRKNVRRAQKNELEVRAGGRELLDDFYGVLEQSWRSLGTPLYRKDYFQLLIDTFPDNVRLYSCRHKETTAAVALVGMFNGTVEGMWAGARYDLRHLQANYVLYWEMLRDTCQLGQKLFHLGRSTADSGSEDFKKK
jgi:FemAB-related protein (PEP-CTERM system-associated)